MIFHNSYKTKILKVIAFSILFHIPSVALAGTEPIGPLEKRVLVELPLTLDISTDQYKAVKLKTIHIHELLPLDNYVQEISDDDLVIHTPFNEAAPLDNSRFTSRFKLARVVEGQYVIQDKTPYPPYLRPHTGVDLSCKVKSIPSNRPIFPWHDGIVVFVGNVANYGNTVIIMHPDLHIYTRYAHLDTINSDVKEAFAIGQGQQLGTCGRSGGQKDIHLHFEAMTSYERTDGASLNNVFVDPYDLLHKEELYTKRSDSTKPSPSPDNPFHPFCSPIDGTCPPPTPVKPPWWPPGQPWPPDTTPSPTPPSPKPPWWPPDGPWPPYPPDPIGPDDLDWLGWIIVNLPHDPNAMYGPDGYVSAGQTMSYQVEFENTGDGIAYGVYVTDVLDANLDDNVLSIKDSYSVDWQTNQQTPANFQYAYDRQSRTFTLLVGEVGSKKGGKFTIETKLKDSLQPGTVTQNFATVHFPTVLETTPTNTIVSVIPRQTQIVYSGMQSVNYSDDALFISTVSLSGQNIIGKTVNYMVGTSSFSAITDEKSLGSAETFTKISLNPGVYTITAAFPGDGYYYLSSTQTATLTVLKDYSIIPDFSTTTYSTSAVSVPVNIFDDEGDQLLDQTGEPKTLYLQYQDSDTWKSLGQAVVSSGTAHFVFNLPQPLRTDYALKATFDGDSKYSDSVSTASLRMVDISSPSVTVLSPSAGLLYTSSVPVHYVIEDNLDPAPTSYAYFTSLISGTTVPALNDAATPTSSLDRGSWTLTVVAQDFSGNMISTTTAAFNIAMDMLPPHTSAEFVNFKSGGALIYASSGAAVVLTAVDDMIASGDNIGLGVAALHWRVGDGDWQIAEDSVPASGKVFSTTAPVSGLADGLHQFQYYAKDKIGNAELIHISTFAVDTQPPAVFISSPQAGAVFSPSSPTLHIAFSYSDAIDTAPIVSAMLVETENKGLLSAPTTFAVANGDTVTYSSLDDGLWRLEVSANDGAGNSTTTVSGLFEVVHDTMPTRSTMSASGAMLSGGVWFAKTASVFTLSSEDDLLSSGDGLGVGVRTQYVTVATSSGGVAGAFSFTQTISTSGVFASTFTLSAFGTGNYAVSYYADDFAGNAESTKTVSVTIDNTPPMVALITPSPSAVGVERAFTGIVAVAASAYDTNLSSWTISFTSSSTWTAVSSGTVVLSSTTAVLWNTSSLSGNYNLRLEACDLAGNCSMQTAPVYVGVPKLVQTMGRREKTRLNLQSPRGIDVGPDGLVWIADAGADRVLAVNGSGVVIHEIGNGCPHKKSTRLEKPQSVAVDAAGNVYVADTGNHRVLKFTPTGELLLEISQSGKRACRLFNPSSLTLDAAGNIYVADTNHSRVSVFSSDGQLSRSFSTTLQSNDYHFADNYGDNDWDRDLRNIFDSFFSHASHPVGIAVSADGNIWISDERQDRLLQFTATGTLIKTIGSAGTSSGKLRHPAGLRIDSAGLLYVADRLNRRAQKLDATGRAYLSINENLYQPVDLAFADNGDLWVVDIFRCTIARYSLPETATGASRSRSGASATTSNTAAVTASGLSATSLLSKLEPDHALYITDIGVKVGKLVKADGGEVIHTNGAHADLPSGAVSSETEITIAESTHTTVQHDAYLKTRKLMPVSAPYEFGPEGLTFAAPATLTLPYDSSQIPSNKTSSDLAIYNWDDVTSAWVPLETQFVNGSLSAKTSHFSLYQVMLQGVNPMAATTFSFRQFFVYPNPAKGGNKPILHLECGVGSGADIRIYDVSGQLRHSAHMDGAPNISSPEYAYEYTWEMGGAGSGVYTAIMEAHSGGETIKAKKKFAIIR